MFNPSLTFLNPAKTVRGFDDASKWKIKCHRAERQVIRFEETPGFNSVVTFRQN